MYALLNVCVHDTHVPSKGQDKKQWLENCTTKSKACFSLGDGFVIIAFLIWLARDIQTFHNIFLCVCLIFCLIKSKKKLTNIEICHIFNYKCHRQILRWLNYPCTLSEFSHTKAHYPFCSLTSPCFFCQRYNTISCVSH